MSKIVWKQSHENSLHALLRGAQNARMLSSFRIMQRVTLMQINPPGATPRGSVGRPAILTSRARSSFVWVYRCHAGQASATRQHIGEQNALTLAIVYRTAERRSLSEINGTKFQGRTLPRASFLDLHPRIDSDPLCASTSSIIPSPVPCSRSPWLQQFRWRPGRSFLRSTGLQSRAIVSSKSILVTWGSVVRKPCGPMDVLGNCLRKDERRKGTSQNGGRDCFGFSHDQARGFHRSGSTFAAMSGARLTL
ncbi:hypothetical protein ACVIQW_001097 [Bradyrhizobium diazoefficiens]